MNVEELLNIEKRYIEIHKRIHMVRNKVGELVPANMNEDIRFLENGDIAKHYSPNGATTVSLKNKGLDDFEILITSSFLSAL